MRRHCCVWFHFRAILPSWLRGSHVSPPLRRRVYSLPGHRSQAESAPALRPSSCRSSSFFSRSAFRFSRFFNWPFRSLMYAILAFILVVTSKPRLPSFLISSFFWAICCSVWAIASRIGRALPRQYSSPFGLSAPPGSLGFARRAPVLGASPTTDTPVPFIPGKSSSVKTLPFAAACFFALALRAASASESCACGGWSGVAGCGKKTRRWGGGGGKANRIRGFAGVTCAEISITEGKKRGAAALRFDRFHGIAHARRRLIEFLLTHGKPIPLRRRRS